MTAPPMTDTPGRLLDRHCQELVADELTRLARRVPSLAEEHLGVVETSLRQIIDRLLPVRRRAEARPETLTALFDLEAS
ncbi:hypothetical protein GCM10023196_056290 [Actinoallomurus vinaceus]|uniref:Uncharacterized protein n=1 Tax=Actinoallomurus vinaceus TaxID=1080074 RepID=A0ABP8UGG2_9ACTN